MRFFVLLTLAACNSGTSSLPSGSFPPSEIPADLTTCTVDADCMVVELGCCDACNGGFVGAFSTSASAASIDALRENCGPEPVACTELGCPPDTAECGEDGTCIVVSGSFGD